MASFGAHTNPGEHSSSLRRLPKELDIVSPLLCVSAPAESLQSLPLLHKTLLVLSHYCPTNLSRRFPQENFELAQGSRRSFHRRSLERLQQRAFCPLPQSHFWNQACYTTTYAFSINCLATVKLQSKKMKWHHLLAIVAVGDCQKPRGIRWLTWSTTTEVTGRSLTQKLAKPGFMLNLLIENCQR